MYEGYKNAERANGITWQELVEREPRLADVLASAEAATPMCKRERRRFDYGHAFSLLRKRFEELVGWYRRPQDPILSSDGAWQVVFARIFDEIYGP